jgi:RNA polymerase sigma-70 factor (sigma-E family)
MPSAGDLVSDPEELAPCEAPSDDGGSLPSLSDLHRSHYQSLVRMAAILLGDLGAAEEVTQDAFLGAYRAVGRLREEDRLLDYLRSSVLNASRSRLRRARVAAGWLSSTRGDRTAPQASMATEDRDLIIRSVRRLPRRQRECLILRHYLDLSEAETARTLGISIGTVKQHVHRAIEALSEAAGEQP